MAERWIVPIDFVDELRYDSLASRRLAAYGVGQRRNFCVICALRSFESLDMLNDCLYPV